MGRAKPSQRQPLPNWLVAAIFTLMTTAIVLGGLIWIADLRLDFALFIASPVGLIMGLIAGRYYQSAGVVGAVFESVLSIIVIVFSAIAAIFAAFSA
ncbi:MAG: hypothetical protein ACR2PF_03155 [Rhizobiaceae bacterium]